MNDFSQNALAFRLIAFKSKV